MICEELKKTPLTEVHRASGAKLVPFAGYEMPVLYSSAIDEHMAVRRGVGVFDVSHMGEVFVEGPGAAALLQKTTCNNVEKLSDGQIQYSALTTPEGCFVDDLLVHRFGQGRYMLCVNAANREKDVRWIMGHAAGDVTVEDRSESYTQIAVQGPKALPVLQALTDTDLSSIKYYWFVEGKVDGTPAIVSRTGYTGEDGFEIYFTSAQDAPRIWRRLFETGKDCGIKPCGLACRNTLRLEAKMALYGNDIDSTTTVLEADLGWICKLTKGDFIGREALQKQADSGLSRKLAGFEMKGRGIARDHYPVLLDGQPTSHVTSGSYAPFLEKNIGLAYLPVSHASVGAKFHVEIRGKAVDAVVVATPFYKRTH